MSASLSTSFELYQSKPGEGLTNNWFVIPAFCYISANEYPEDWVIEREEMTPCNCDPRRDVCGDECGARQVQEECNPKTCPVGRKCTNQRMGRGKGANIERFLTEKKGYGVRTLQDLKEGDFIAEYAGELLSESEFELRKDLYGEFEVPHFYFMELDKGLTIDACQRGTIARFFNHSCEPNLETQEWLVNGERRIGLFARQDIPRGTELCFDYKFQTYGNNAQTCHCGAPSCAGVIGGRKRKKESGKDSHQRRKRRGGETNGNGKHDDASDDEEESSDDGPRRKPGDARMEQDQLIKDLHWMKVQRISKRLERLKASNGNGIREDKMHDLGELMQVAGTMDQRAAILELLFKSGEAVLERFVENNYLILLQIWIERTMIALKAIAECDPYKQLPERLRFLPDPFKEHRAFLLQCLKFVTRLPFDRSSEKIQKLVMYINQKLKTHADATIAQAAAATATEIEGKKVVRMIRKRELKDDEEPGKESSGRDGAGGIDQPFVPFRDMYSGQQSILKEFTHTSSTSSATAAAAGGGGAGGATTSALTSSSSSSGVAAAVMGTPGSGGPPAKPETPGEKYERERREREARIRAAVEKRDRERAEKEQEAADLFRDQRRQREQEEERKRQQYHAILLDRIGTLSPSSSSPQSDKDVFRVKLGDIIYSYLLRQLDKHLIHSKDDAKYLAKYLTTGLMGKHKNLVAQGKADWNESWINQKKIIDYAHSYLKSKESPYKKP